MRGKVTLTPGQISELLTSVAAGDRNAFAVIFKTWSPKVYADIFRITRKTDLAEDLLQDVFLKVWVKREAIPKVENFQSYLYHITRNHTFDALKKIARQEVTDEAVAEFIHLDEGSYAAEGEEMLVQREQELRAAIDHLPLQQRTAFTMCQVDGLSYQQAAEKMNISPLTVKTHLMSARKTLRDTLGKTPDKSSQGGATSPILKLSFKLGLMALAFWL